jgi:hypothetical protein
MAAMFTMSNLSDTSDTSDTSYASDVSLIQDYCFIMYQVNTDSDQRPSNVGICAYISGTIGEILHLKDLLKIITRLIARENACYYFMSNDRISLDSMEKSGNIHSVIGRIPMIRSSDLLSIIEPFYTKHAKSLSLNQSDNHGLNYDLFMVMLGITQCTTSCGGGGGSGSSV